MNKKVLRTLTAALLVLVTAAFVFNGRAQTRTPRPAPPVALKYLPASDAVMLIDVRRMLNETMPQILAGDKENAALCWRRAAFLDPFNGESATLAGAQLVKRFGPDRGGMPKEYVDQEAKIAKEANETQTTETKAEE